jgi:restriction system protein
VAPTVPAAPLSSHGLAYTLGGLVLATLAGGVIYLYRRRQSPARASSPAVATARLDALPDAPVAVSGAAALRLDQFELLIGEIFRRQGYTVELSAAVNAEDGIDLVLRRDGETIPVQCKHWKMAHVTERELREFYGAMATSGAPRGILVTTGDFGPAAKAFAAGKGIELLDGSALTQNIATAARPGENLCHVAEWLDDFISHARIFDPECPVCHGTMVIRHNRANGTPSWSCRGYPRCPGRREPRLDLLPNAAAS